MKGPILCFVGPPGVGKTSLGQSIARAMNRTVRAHLARRRARRGGDSRPPPHLHRLDARPHRPGAEAGGLDQPGVHARRDRQDVSAGFQGDPAAALLEVLDPAQNHSFRDHYLEITVRSVARAVHRDGEPARHDPSGAARSHGDHLAGRLHRGGEAPHRAPLSGAAAARARTGCRPTALELERRGAAPRDHREYTREAGVRNLERQIGAVARKVAARVAGALPAPAQRPPPRASASAGRDRRTPIPIAPAITAVGSGSGDGCRERQPVATTQAAANIPTTIVDGDHVPEYLGQPRFRQEVAFRTSRPGVATGVAWTESGGDVLFIEASLLPGGHRNLILTGQLGNVMQESARAAVSHIRSTAGDARRRAGVPRDSTTCTSTCRPARFRRTARRPA